jgi:hypothetical protein
VVLDPFCGCGTTIDAAQKLGRDWIGIDGTILFGDDPKAAISAGSESRYYRLIRNWSSWVRCGIGGRFPVIALVIGSARLGCAVLGAPQRIFFRFSRSVRHDFERTERDTRAPRTKID